MLAAIRALAEAPRPFGSRKLSGREAYQIRVGNYRVIHRMEDDELVVEALGVGHRREVYRLASGRTSTPREDLRLTGTYTPGIRVNGGRRKGRGRS